MTTDTMTDLGTAFTGLQALIDATVKARVEAALQKERAELQKLVDNTTAAALQDVRARVQAALNILEGI